LTMGRPLHSTLFPYSTLFRSHLGKAFDGLLDLGREVGRLEDLPDFDDLVVRGGAASCPCDRLVLRLHVDDPVAADRFLRLGERRSEEHTSELQSREKIVCRLL